MTGSRPAIALIFGVLAWCLGGAVQAQDLWEGKSPEELFRLNCSVCHKSPAGLASAGDKAGGLFGLESFLAQHYTASGRSAQLIANYLKAVDSATGRDRQPRHRTAKPRKPASPKTDTARKTDADKPRGKSDRMKGGEGKSDAPKADAAAKSSDAKISEPDAGKPKMTGPKPEKPGAAGSRGDTKSRTTGNKPGGEGTSDKKTN